ncbi:uncharacterized protein LOC118567373 isoform X3 [Mus musculus]|uniref:uncharacterized protein LOC118567373 isoform X3 n=1 Tax=Mus musculus TaxID=10090 RepID=UPI001678C865|nr:uncharacterized protein LOC118567373 isoform X3 [Mus musculus]
MTQSKAIGRMCIPSRSLSPPSCFFWHKLQPGKGVRIQRFPQVLCSDGPYKAGSNGSQGSSAAVLQPVQASKPTVRCLWLWNPLHFGALSQSECPEGEAHLLGRVGEDSPPFPPESECRPPTGRQRRHLSYKDALQVSQPVCPQVLLCSLPWSQVLSSYDRSVLFPVQVLSWASGYLQAASANELLAGQGRRQIPAAPACQSTNRSVPYKPARSQLCFPDPICSRKQAPALEGLHPATFPQLSPLDLFAVWACCSLDSSQEALTPKSIYGRLGLQGRPPRAPEPG